MGNRAGARFLTKEIRLRTYNLIINITVGCGKSERNKT